MIKKAMAGKVVEVGELTEYNEEAGSYVVNLKVETESKNRFGFVDTREKRIVLFHRLAEKASKELQAGDLVFLDECYENPGEYVNKRGALVKTMDVIANMCMKVKKEIFEDLKKAIDKENEALETSEAAAIQSVDF